MRRAFVSGVLLAAFAFPAAAADAASETQLFCPDGTVSICGLNVPVSSMPFGSSVILTMPAPYLHQPFTVVCEKSDNSLYYQISDSSAVTCAPQVCPISKVELCGSAIQVPGGTFIGNTIDVPVPPSVLTDPSKGKGLSFTVQCTDRGNNDIVYQITDASDVSCNLFPCRNTTVNLCGISVPVNGGKPMGAAINLTMPPPFKPDTFTVQCVGSEGTPPSYQLTDTSGVSCKPIASAP
jgi:hypothetical protein